MDLLVEGQGWLQCGWEESELGRSSEDPAAQVRSIGDVE